MKKDTRFIPKLIAFIFLLVMAVIWVVPLAWGIVTSFKSEAEVASVGFKFLPVQWVTTNYTELLFDNAATPLLRWFMNSMIIALSQTVLVLIVVSLAAFAYSRLKFRGRNAMFVFLMATMMFPSVVNLIPLYKIIDTFGWVNNYLAAIVPGAAAVFNIFLVRQFMVNIPIEFDEAARMDGAGDFKIFYKVILPLLRPVLMVVALFTFTAAWNDFLWPSIVFNDIEMMPITPGLQLLQGMYQAQPAHLMAGALVAIVPTFILYLFAQKYFLQSMALSSGVKG
ncbi:ABC transporter permease [Listeria newyorkensis]|uniref:ABC transporter permease n=2 Tax=Listeria TaxID=1637 RepID=A0A841YZC3_9LIST|nr:MULTISPECIES: carbohydrate ABC transporter permease [Listeria]KGL37728.1 N-acetyl-D-glucosamine ABC transporter permease [Listeriaceae bacterium FSL A5-0209]EUJ31867.1 ABC-type sugar transport system, permease component [Listeria cornellensis FSL F6-0969]KGL44451.1 N-acetyl-D-glucosamine ABC transporter permease [Listeria newyorkensis]KMT62832.1 ABC-type sugar transport system, permease component [Listeria newyorkensis]MBC1458874.1 carbohydrate ABC transporter permease [Listeria newyorkensi